MYIITYYYILLYIIIYYYILLYIIVYYYILLYIIIYYYTLLYIIVYYYILLYIIVYYYILLYYYYYHYYYEYPLIYQWYPIDYTLSHINNDNIVTIYIYIPVISAINYPFRYPLHPPKNTSAYSSRRMLSRASPPEEAPSAKRGISGPNFLGAGRRKPKSHGCWDTAVGRFSMRSLQIWTWRSWAKHMAIIQ